MKKGSKIKDTDVYSANGSLDPFHDSSTFVGTLDQLEIFKKSSEEYQEKLGEFRSTLTEAAISMIKTLEDGTHPKLIQIAEAIHDLPALVRVLQDQIFLINHAISSLSKSYSNETQKQS